jgi:hypothetical protein
VRCKLPKRRPSFAIGTCSTCVPTNRSIQLLRTSTHAYARLRTTHCDQPEGPTCARPDVFARQLWS